MNRRTSAIWKFFTNVGEYQATCNLCGGNNRFSYRTTLSNLGRHISRKHPHAMSGIKLFNLERAKDEMVVDESMKKECGGGEERRFLDEDSGEGDPNATSEDQSQTKPNKERPPPNLLHHDYSRNPESRKRSGGRHHLLAENGLYRGVELREPPGSEPGSLGGGRTLGWGLHQRDESEAYGEYIGHKLRKMDGRTRTLVQNQINNILFEVDMTYYEGRNRQGGSRGGYYESTRKERQGGAVDPTWTASLVQEGTPLQGEEEDVVIESSSVVQEDNPPPVFLQSNGDESSGMVNGYVEGS